MCFDSYRNWTQSRKRSSTFSLQKGESARRKSVNFLKSSKRIARFTATRSRVKEPRRRVVTLKLHLLRSGNNVGNQLGGECRQCRHPGNPYGIITRIANIPLFT